MEGGYCIEIPKKEPFILRKFINAFSRTYIEWMVQLSDLNKDNEIKEAKDLTLKLRTNLGPFFGLTQAIAGLSRMWTNR